MTSLQQAKSVVIFGGSGFIGSHLAARLLQLGIKVRIADIHSPKFENIDYRECDVRNPINFDDDFRPDFAINLAAIHRTPGHSPHEYYETNILGAINITHWCSNYQVKNLLFSSSISVYGETEFALDEYSATEPTSDYGYSKLIAENVHIQWSSLHTENRIIIVRPAVIFGAGENGNFSRMASAISKGFFVFPTNSRIYKACGYVEDLVDSFFFSSAEKSQQLIYNFCFPKVPTVNAIGNAMSAVGGWRKPFVLPLKFIVPVLLHSGLTPRILALRIRKLLNSTNILPTTLQDLGFNWNHTLETALLEWHEISNFDIEVTK